MSVASFTESLPHVQGLIPPLKLCTLVFVTKEFAISLPQEVLFSHVLLVRR